MSYDDASIFPSSDQVLWDLFTDEFIANLQDRIGEPRLSIDTGIEVKAIGFAEFLAAEIIDALVQAGFTHEGRPFDLSQVSTGGMQRIYPGAQEVADTMGRRATDLRRKGRLLGGTYNPLIKAGQVTPGVVNKWTLSFPVGSGATLDLQLPDEALLSIAFQVSPAASPEVVSTGTFTETVGDLRKAAHSQSEVVGTLPPVTFQVRIIGSAPDVTILASAASGGNAADYSTVTVLIYRIPAGAVGEPGARGAVGPQGEAGNDARGDITDTEFANVLGALWGDARDVEWDGTGNDGARIDFGTPDSLHIRFASANAAATEAKDLKAAGADAVWLRSTLYKEGDDVSLGARDNDEESFAWFDSRNITKPWSLYFNDNELRLSFGTGATTIAPYQRTISLKAGDQLKVTITANSTQPNRVGNYAVMQLGFNPQGQQAFNGVNRISLRRDTNVAWDTTGGLDPTNECAHACNDVFKVEWIRPGGTEVEGDIIMGIDPAGISTQGVSVLVDLTDRLWSRDGETLQEYKDRAVSLSGWVRFNDRAGAPSTTTPGDNSGGGGGGGGGTGTDGDISDAEFSGFLSTIYGQPSTINYKDNIGTAAGDGIVSTGNTVTFGSDTFIGYKVGSAGAAATLADNLLAGDGVLTSVRLPKTGSTVVASAAALRVGTAGGTSTVGLTTYPYIRTSSDFITLYYASRADAEASTFATLSTNDEVTLTAISTSDGGTSSRLNQTATWTIGTGPVYTTLSYTNPSISVTSISFVGCTLKAGSAFSAVRGSSLGSYSGWNSTNAASAGWINYSMTLKGEGFQEAKAAEIMGTIAGVDIVETDVLRIWLRDELWTVGEDQWGDIPNGKGDIRFLRSVTTRAAMELAGVPAAIFGTNANGRLGNIPTADLAAHIVGPEGKFFTLLGTWGLTTGGALPSTARKISISGSGNTRIVNITGTATAADRVNQHLQAFITDGNNITIRVSTAQTGGWRFKITGSVNVNTLANGGWGFTATTISGTPPTNTVSTYTVTVDGDIVRWAELFTEGIKPAIKAGTNMTVVADDAAGTLTLNSTASGGGSTAWGDITGKPATFYTLPTATTTTKGGLETATQAEADALSALDKMLTPSVLKEAVYECLKSILAAGTNITVTNSDTAHTSTLAASASGGGGGSGPLSGSAVAGTNALSLTTSDQYITGWIDYGTGSNDRGASWVHYGLTAYVDSTVRWINESAFGLPINLVGQWLYRKVSNGNRWIEITRDEGTGANAGQVRLKAKRVGYQYAQITRVTVFNG